MSIVGYNKIMDGFGLITRLYLLPGLRAVPASIIFFTALVNSSNPQRFDTIKGYYYAS